MRHERLESPRELVWEGCVNVRDLGGQPIEGNGLTRFGVVVRADNVRKLTPAGWKALLAHGVRRVVDLRWHEELADDAPTDAPVEVVHIPLFGAHRLETRYARFAEISAQVDDATEFMRRLYGSYLDDYPDAFAEAITAVASTDGTAVVHCTAGKDRTGLVSALLLRIAGVGIDQIAADYGLTDTRPLRAGGPTGIPGHGTLELTAEEARARQFVLAAPPDGIAMVLHDLDDRYGSAAAYLEGAGLERPVLETIRRRLAGTEPVRGNEGA
jgi:protein-tyrosine phosphatase